MTQYRKKPVIIEAVQWDGNATTANKFLGEDYEKDWWYTDKKDGSIYIPTLEGNHECRHGDFIIKGVKGEFYPCKPDIFEMTYEPVLAPHTGKEGEGE